MLILVLTASTLFQAGGAAPSSKSEAPQTANSDKKPEPLGMLEMLNTTEGVDFGPYLRDVFLAIRKQWFANLPSSVRKGEQGWDKVEVCILRDGTVPKDCLQVVDGSKKGDFDETSLRAVREAAPFAKLPAEFSQPQIVLRMLFHYNMKPQK
ncbi:MAG TPA: energy transducer TonB [Candidatus Acidoferrum sp.]|nr:energy transducer TonB [Candidatus Acidoferrum sp.]